MFFNNFFKLILVSQFVRILNRGMEGLNRFLFNYQCSLFNYVYFFKRIVSEKVILCVIQSNLSISGSIYRRLYRQYQTFKYFFTIYHFDHLSDFYDCQFLKPVNLFQPGAVFYIETSYLICTANEWFLYEMQHWPEMG